MQISSVMLVSVAAINRFELFAEHVKIKFHTDKCEFLGQFESVSVEKIMSPHSDLQNHLKQLINIIKLRKTTKNESEFWFPRTKKNKYLFSFFILLLLISCGCKFSNICFYKKGNTTPTQRIHAQIAPKIHIYMIKT